VRALMERARSEKNINIVPFARTERLIVEGGRAVGVEFLDPILRGEREIIGRAVIICTGGAGQLYLHTTNPEVATGDGMAMAYAAGAEMADMEFVQFHPTALALKGAPRFLLSEAMRGEGGILRNKFGERFMPHYDERAELAPRDIVSRSIVAEMLKSGSREVFLDMTELGEKFLVERFPKIYATCKAYGLDIARDLLPVSPASHYFMGGIRVDLHGRTNIPGLYAAGEVTCTGVHGANRLASNSLLEGLVFGARSGAAAVADTSNQTVRSFARTIRAANDRSRVSNEGISTAVRKRVKRVMWERVGIIRNRDGISKAIAEFEQIAAADVSAASRNFVSLALLVSRAALWREESRGGHFREDFPSPLEEFRFHSIQCRDFPEEIRTAGTIALRLTKDA